MLVPLLARMLAPRSGVAVRGASLAGGPCRAAACMRAPPESDKVRPASRGGASSSAGRGSAADSSWSELLDCLRAYQADTDQTAFPGTPGTPGTGFTVPAGFVVPSRAPYAGHTWGDALGKRAGRLAEQARRGTLGAERRRELEAVGLDLRSARERGFDELVLTLTLTLTLNR